MRGGPQAGGLTKANRQLLLAAELTFDESRAEQLAELAHQVGEHDSMAEVSTDELDDVEATLQGIADDAHEDVADAIGRALDLLTTHRQALTPV